MSKTFKNRVSVRDAENVLEITNTPAGVRITVSDEDRIVSGWFNPDQGAEIALAILEAAGGRDALGIDVSNAMIDLREYVTEQGRITAEAEAQAKLEAEALELYNVCMTGHNLTSFNGLGGTLRDQWIAVARRAREINKEASNGR